jgi:hypothetical protein
MTERHMRRTRAAMYSPCILRVGQKGRLATALTLDPPRAGRAGVPPRHLGGVRRRDERGMLHSGSGAGASRPPKA